jgi:uncharacterized repeat protein (TIGR03803 family)
VLGLDGSLYGTANEGGTNGAGAIFQFTQTGGLIPLYSFNYLLNTGVVYINYDGGEPLSLFQTSDGNFYGLGSAGGTNGYGTFFRIGLPPQITVQPTNQTVSLHGSATFSISATGVQTCQWLFDNTNLPNATNYTLTITNVLLANAGYYEAVVTNINGATASSIASLAISNAAISFASDVSLANGQATFELTNLAGQGVVVIDASVDLRNWTPIFTNPPSFGALQFTDSNAASYTNRFYRARIQ